MQLKIFGADIARVRIAGGGSWGVEPPSVP